MASALESIIGRGYQSRADLPAGAERACRECGIAKPIAEFTRTYRQRDTGKRLSIYCEQCVVIVRRKNANAWVARKRAKDPLGLRANQREINKRFYAKNADRLLADNRIKRRALKQEFVSRYGGACACCGETEIDFLTLDHVNGNGAHDRQRVLRTGGSCTNNDRIMRRLRKAGWPEQTDYQPLCFNCNCTKGYFGSCPHQRNAK